MAYRVFASPDGAVWRVWDVPAVRGEPGPLGPREEHLREGWLCFECDGEKRRLAPAPERWAERGEEQLWLYCRVAEPVAPSRRDAARGLADVPEPPAPSPP